MKEGQIEGGENKERNVTEELRSVAEAFILKLGYERVRYKEACQSAGVVLMTIAADEDEIGRPASLHVRDTSAFVREFRRKHINAFDALPEKVEIDLELRTWPEDGHFLRLDL